MKKHILGIIYTTIFTIAIIIFAYVIIIKPITYKPAIPEDVYYLNSNWEYIEEEEENVTFPFRDYQKYGNIIHLKNTLPNDITDNAVVYVQTNYQTIDVFVDGIKMDIISMTKNPIFKIRNGNPWIQFSLPEGSEGKNIELEITSHGSKVFVEVYDVIVGDETSIRFVLLDEELPPLIIAAFMMTLAIIILIISLILIKKYQFRISSNFLYIGTFVFLASSWILTDTKLQAIYFVDSNAYFIATLFSYMLIPIPLVLYFRRQCETGKKVFLFFSIMLFVYFIINTIIVMTGSHILSANLTFTHILVAISIVLCSLYSAIEIFVNKNKNLIIMFIGLIILTITGIITMGQFYFKAIDDNTACFKVGVFAFVILLVSSYFGKIINTISEERNIELLRISEEEYRVAAKHSEKYVYKFDIQTRTIYYQKEILELFNLPLKINNIPNNKLILDLIDDDSKNDFMDFFESICQGSPTCVTNYQMLNKNGQLRWYRSNSTTIYNNSGKPIQAIISFFDATDLRDKEIAFRKWQQDYQSLPNEAIKYYEYNLTCDSFDCEEGRLLEDIPDNINKTLSDVSLYICNKHIYKEDRQKFLEFYSKSRLMDCYEKGIKNDEVECRRIGKNDDPLWISLSVQLINDPFTNNIKAFILLQDIDKKKKNEEILNYRSTIDSLTQVYNRSTFIEKMNDLLKDSKKKNNHILIMIDVDGFKDVNDNFGHQFGDMILANISTTLTGLLRGDDLVGRIGGDEFLICLKNVPLHSGIAEERASVICKTLKKDLGMNIHLSVSIGISIFPKDGTTFEELYQKADKAVYSSKHSGKGKYTFYSKDVEEEENIVNGITLIDEQTSKYSYDNIKGTGKDNLIIVADDDLLNRAILCEILDSNYTVIEAENGSILLDELKQYGGSISVILLDLEMPVIDGFKVLEIMAKDTFLSTIPVIIVSAHTDYEYNAKAIELGAIDFINKPIEPELVRLRVKNAIVRRKLDDIRTKNRLQYLKEESIKQSAIKQMKETTEKTKKVKSKK